MWTIFDQLLPSRGPLFDLILPLCGPSLINSYLPVHHNLTYFYHFMDNRSTISTIPWITTDLLLPFCGQSLINSYHPVGHHLTYFYHSMDHLCSSRTIPLAMFSQHLPFSGPHWSTFTITRTFFYSYHGPFFMYCYLDNLW